MTERFRLNEISGLRDVPKEPGITGEVRGSTSTDSTSTGPKPGESNKRNEELGRRLENRQVQLISIGGSIGTAVFVNIGAGLAESGPLPLVLMVSVYSVLLSCVNNSLAQMSVQYPMTGGFARLAGHWLHPSLGFAAAWMVWIYYCILIPFEINAAIVVLKYWIDCPEWYFIIGLLFFYTYAKSVMANCRRLISDV